MKSLSSIAWVGDLGFPIGLAEIQKVILLCKGLNEQGIKTTVISRYGIHDKARVRGVEIEGVYDGINYIYASGKPYRPNKFITRNVFKFVGLIREIAILITKSMKQDLDAVILHTNSFYSILHYKLLSLVLGIPLIMLYVEQYGSCEGHDKGFAKLNDRLYENYCLKLLDGVMPISDYLMNFVKEKAHKVQRLKVPMITDCSRFESVEITSGEQYFLFCGGAGYMEIIDFSITAFERVLEENVELYLIVGGSKQHINALRKRIGISKKYSKINLYSDISEEKLNVLYANAIGMLIPLRPTVQDKARFPHKIGEYLSTANPLITNNYGEASAIFTDEVNALVAQEFEVEQFSEKMQYVLDNPGKAKEIGINGKKLAQQLFDYKTHGVRVKAFINSIINYNTI